MTLRNQVLSALMWTLISRLGTQMVSWVITILVMRLLMPKDYGLLAMATIFSGLLAPLAEIGLGSSLVQIKEVSPRLIRQVFALVLLANFTACLLLAFVIGPLAGIFFAEPRLEAIMPVIALQFIPSAFAVIPNAMLDREMRYRGRAFVDFSASLCGSLLTLGLAYAGFGAWSLAWGGVTQTFLRAMGLNIIRPSLYRPLFRFSGSGQIIRFGRDVAANQLLFYLYAQADSLIVGKLLGKHELGLYSVSMNLASMPTSRIAAVVNQVAFPAMSKVRREGGSVNNYIVKSMRSLSLLSFPVMWGMSSVSPELVAGILGEQWLEATTALTLLCLAMPLRVLSPILNTGLQSVGRADLSFRNSIFIVIVMCAAFVYGGQFSLLGVAMAWVMAFPLVFLVNVARSRKHLDLSLRAVTAALLRPLLSSILMYAAVWAAREGLNSPSLPPELRHFTSMPLPRLGVLVFTGGLTYILGSLLINRKGIAEAVGLLRPAKSRNVASQ